jgi:hypothetical protein
MYLNLIYQINPPIMLYFIHLEERSSNKDNLDI